MKTEISDIAEYIVMIISEFADRFSLTNRQSYRYINRYGGIGMIMQHYGIIHTLSFDDAVDAVAKFCKRKGGHI